MTDLGFQGLKLQISDSKIDKVEFSEKNDAPINSTYEKKSNVDELTRILMSMMLMFDM